MPASFDLCSAETGANPYPQYRRLRAEDPVHWSDDLQVWVVTRHREVTSLLRDPRWSADFGRAHASVDATPRRTRDGPRLFLFMDAPEHTALRRVVSAYFTSALLEDTRHHVGQLARELLERRSAGVPCDIVGEFAYPLATRTLTRVLGIPSNEDDLFVARGTELSGLLDWNPTGATLDDAADVAGELVGVMARLLRDRRGGSTGGLVSDLAAAARARTISYADAISSAMLVFLAGYMTTTNFISNAALVLLQLPEARAEFTGSSSPGVAVTELLRYDSPVQITPRTAVADVELCGRRIRRGDRALAVIGSANRDELVFSDPDVLDLSRPATRNVAFGAGSHFCVGASLARTMGDVALRVLLARMPAVPHVPRELRWRRSTTQRGPAALWMVPDTQAVARA